MTTKLQLILDSMTPEMREKVEQGLIAMQESSMTDQTNQCTVEAKNIIADEKKTYKERWMALPPKRRILIHKMSELAEKHRGKIVEGTTTTKGTESDKGGSSSKVGREKDMKDTTHVTGKEFISLIYNSIIMTMTKERTLAILLFLSGIVYLGFGIYFLFGDNPPTKPKEIFLVVSIFFLYPFFTCLYLYWTKFGGVRTPDELQKISIENEILKKKIEQKELSEKLNKKD